MFSALLLVFLVSPLPGPAPEVTFTLDDDEVVMRLSRGNPATVLVYAPGYLAEGETDDNGRGRFPLPPAPRFWVGIKIAGKECDLIPLVREGDHLAPARVSLTFGTRPCCKVPIAPRPDQSPPADEPPVFDWLLVAIALTGGALITSALLLLLKSFVRMV